MLTKGSNPAEVASYVVTAELCPVVPSVDIGLVVVVVVVIAELCPVVPSVDIGWL